MATRSKGGGARKSSVGAETATQSQLFPEPEPAEAGEGRMMYSLPPRFRAYSEPEHHMVVLVDEETGKQVPVAIGAYGEVRRVLGALFGGEAEERDDYVPPSVEPLDETAAPPARGPEPVLPPGGEARAVAAPPKRVPGAVEIPAPSKRLIGIALRSYKRKWLVDHGYDPDQEAVIAGTPAAAAQAEAPSAAARVEAAPAVPASGAGEKPEGAGGVVEVPAPPKRLVGIALRSYKRKWLADHGYDPGHEAVVAAAPPQAVAGRAEAAPAGGEAAAPGAGEAPRRVPGAVEVPAPAKRLFGVALKSYVRKWLADHGYDPDQEAVVAAAPPRAAAVTEADEAAAAGGGEAPKRAPGPVEIPAPPKRLFGVALESYKRKWLADHGYDPGQEAVVAAAPPQAVAGRAEAAPAAEEPKAGRAGTEAPAPSGGEARGAGAAQEEPIRIPEGWEPIIEGEGYVMEFALDPTTHANGYRVVVDGEVVGWLREEGPTRYVLYSPQELWTESVHRNILGARTRLDVMYEPDS